MKPHDDGKKTREDYLHHLGSTVMVSGIILGFYTYSHHQSGGTGNSVTALALFAALLVVVGWSIAQKYSI